MACLVLPLLERLARRLVRHVAQRRVVGWRARERGARIGWDSRRIVLIDCKGRREVEPVRTAPLDVWQRRTVHGLARGDQRPVHARVLPQSQLARVTGVAQITCRRDARQVNQHRRPDQSGEREHVQTDARDDQKLRPVPLVLLQRPTLPAVHDQCGVVGDGREVQPEREIDGGFDQRFRRAVVAGRARHEDDKHRHDDGHVHQSEERADHG